MKKMVKTIGKVLGVVILAVVILLVVLLMAAPNLAVKMINSPAGDFINAEVSVVDIDLNLFRGYVAIEGLTVGQPKGFEGGPLLDLPHAHVKIAMGSLLNPPLPISDVLVRDLRATIIKNADGVLNVETLAQTPRGPQEEPPPQDRPTGGPPAVALEQLLIDNIKVRYVDASLGKGDPLAVGVSNLVLEATDVLFDVGAASDLTLPGRVKLTSQIMQGQADDAYLGVIARLGVLNSNTPAVNAGVRIAGLEFKGLAYAWPGVATGIAALLGDSGMDLETDIAMAPGVRQIDVVLVNKTVRLELPMRGGLDNITKDLSALLTARLAGSVTGAAGNMGAAGVGVVDTTVQSAGSVVKGAGKVAGNVGGGLFNLVKGATKGDLKSVGQALQETTAGSVKEAMAAVTNVAGTAVSGVGQAAGMGLGRASADAWRTNASARWSAAWEAVVTKVDGMPYPTAEEEAE